tara:strand:+ start:9122 stop:9979 length:858 start_codon:yes stop_codon:yes gene_type:complete
MNDIENYLQEKQQKTINLLHGTNRKYEKHCSSKNRTVLNDKYQGDWICYTKNIEVAWKYAKAARNQCFDKQLFLNDTENFLNDYPNVKNDLLVLTNLLLDKGSEVWDEFYEYYSKEHNIDINDTPKSFFDKIREIENTSNFDINDFMDALEEVEYSKLAEPDDNINFFSNNIKQISQSNIEFLKSIGFDSSLPENRVLVSEVSYNKLLETTSREEAKKARENGYDLVIYSGEGCVDNEPEYLIADPRQVTVKNIIIENIQLEYLDELKTSWREKKEYSTKRPKFK